MIRSDDFEPLPPVEMEEPAPRTLLVRLRGDLEDVTTGRMRTELDRELSQHRVSRLLVDLSRVTLLGPAALGLLLHLHRQCRREDMHLVLVGTARPAVHRPLRTSGLLPLFHTRPTVRAALHWPYTARPTPPATP